MFHKTCNSLLFILVVSFVVPNWGAIIGADDLELVSETTGFPFRTIGRIFLGDVNKGGCTGVLIHPRIVLASAHCIYDRIRGRYYEGYSFSPGMNGLGGEPFGKIGSSSVRVSPEYLDDPSFQYHDYGIVVLNESFVDVCTARGFDDCEQFMQIEDQCTSRSFVLNTIGYRGDIEEEFFKMWVSRCTDIVVDCNVPSFQHTCDTTIGMAGAPLIVLRNSQEQIQYAIKGIHVAARWANGTFVNQAITLNNDVVSRINEWISDVGL